MYNHHGVSTLSDIVPIPDGTHPGNFRHELLYTTELPEKWQDLYEGLIAQAELQVRILFGASVLHSMLIERATYLFVRQKMMDQFDPVLAMQDPTFQANYNASLRQFLKVTEQLSKYETASHVTPESAFLYTVMAIIDKEVTDAATKRRIGESLLALKKTA